MQKWEENNIMLNYNKMAVNAHVNIRQLEEMLEAVKDEPDTQETYIIRSCLNDAIGALRVAINEMSNLEAGQKNTGE